METGNTENKNIINNSSTRPGSKTLVPGHTGIPGHDTLDESIKKILPLIYIEFDLEGKIIAISNMAKAYLTAGKSIVSLDDLNKKEMTNEWLENIRLNQELEILPTKLQIAENIYWLSGMITPILQFQMVDRGVLILRDVTKEVLLEEELKEKKVGIIDSSENKQNLTRVLFDGKSFIKKIDVRLAEFLSYPEGFLLGKNLNLILGDIGNYRRQLDSASGVYLPWDFRKKDNTIVNLLSRIIVEKGTGRFFLEINLGKEQSNKVDLRIIESHSAKKQAQKLNNGLSNHFMYCVTNEQGKIVEFSTRLAEYFQCEANEVIGKSFKESFLDNVEYGKYIQGQSKTNRKEESMLIEIGELTQLVVLETAQLSKTRKIHYFLLEKNELLDNVQLARDNEHLKTAVKKLREEALKSKAYQTELESMDIIDPDSERLKLQELRIKNLEEKNSSLEGRLESAQSLISDLEADAAVGGVDDEEQEDMVRTYKKATKEIEISYQTEKRKSAKLEIELTELKDALALLKLIEAEKEALVAEKNTLLKSNEEMFSALEANKSVIGSFNFKRDQQDSEIEKLQESLLDQDVLTRQLAEQRDIISESRDTVEQLEIDIEILVANSAQQEISEYEHSNLIFEIEEFQTKKKNAELKIEELQINRKSNKERISQLEHSTDEFLRLLNEEKRVNLKLEEEKTHLEAGIEEMAKELDVAEIAPRLAALPLESSLGVVEKFAEILADDLDDASKIIKLNNLTFLFEKIVEIKTAVPEEINVLDLSLALQEKCIKDIPEEIEYFTGLGRKLKNINMNKKDLDLLLEIVLKNAEEAVLEKGGEGEIKFSTRNVIENDQEFIRFRISDTGIGISEKNLTEVKSRFFTNKEDHVGLGLTVANYIVEEAGGKLEIVSQEGNATSVSIYIPVIEGVIEKEIKEEETLLDKEIDAAFKDSGLLTIDTEKKEAVVVENPEPVLVVEIARYKVRDNWKGKGRKLFIKQSNKDLLKLLERAGYKTTEKPEEARLSIFDFKWMEENIKILNHIKKPILFISYTEQHYQTANITMKISDDTIFRLDKGFDTIEKWDSLLEQVAHLSKIKAH